MKTINILTKAASFSVVMIFLISFATESRATTYTVDTTADDAALTACTSVPNDCSLRGAIANANATSADDTIDFVIPSDAPGCTAGEGCMITLTNGTLFTGSTLTITNSIGMSKIVISGNNQSRVFTVSGNLTLNAITVTNGNSSSGGGGIFLNTGALVLINCTVSGNSASGSGGGIHNGNLNGGYTVTLTNSTVSGNSAGTNGGGIHNASQAVLTLTNSTISGNSAGNSGGGIFSVWQFPSPPSVVNIGNSIIADNTGNSPNLGGFGQINSHGYNLIGIYSDPTTFTGTGDQVGTAENPINALLGPLQNNGGLTPTHALLPGSPAIDKGNSFSSTTDQRGSMRPADFASVPNADDGTDIGAFELQIPTAAVATVTGRVMTAGGAGISRAFLTMVDTNGRSRTAFSNPFGYFRFENVPVGETYFVTVNSKNHHFTPQVISVYEDITDLNLVADSMENDSAIDYPDRFKNSDF